MLSTLCFSFQPPAIGAFKIEMKGTKLTSKIWILSLALLVSVNAFHFRRDLPGRTALSSPSMNLFGGKKGEGILGRAARNTTTSSTLVPTSASTSVAESSTPSDLPLRSSPTPVSTTSHSGGMSSQHRRLIIILSSVLGSVGLVLIVAAIFLGCRYGKRRAPFRNRGTTPIDDEEIESWRISEQKQQSPIPDSKSPQTPRGASIDSIALRQSPPWAWTGSPAALHSMNSPANVQEPSAFIAKAPNSRIGLTDETVPGADAFIPPPKRQGSRLSKAPPGHARNKSGRSSISAKSVRSNHGGSVDLPKPTDKAPAWYDPDNESVGTGLRDTEYTNSSPATPVFDGLNAGGLSPRPKSKSQLGSWDSSQEIGRAIA